MKLLFIVLIIICAVFYVMYIWNFALVLLIIISALPVVMFVTTLITKHLMEVSFSVKNETAPKNENFPVQIRIKNRSIFPIGKAEAHIEYYNVFNNQINTFELYMPIQAMNSQSVTFQLSSKFCGIVKIKCACIYISDPLRIFKFKTGKNMQSEIAVLPEGHEISGSVCCSDRINEESLVFSETKAGDDPSEVFDLRDYHAGDKLNRIHWKLSSKKDEFIVKDYSLPVDIPATLFLNLRCYEDSKYTLPVFDTLIETLVSVSQFMLENERIHSIAYFNEKENRFVERIVYDSESLSQIISELIFSINDNMYCEQPEIYFFDNENLSLSSFTFITSVPDTNILAYIDEKVDADIKNAVIVVKNQEQSQSISEGFAELNTIPITIGRITSSVKDIQL